MSALCHPQICLCCLLFFFLFFVVVVVGGGGLFFVGWMVGLSICFQHNMSMKLIFSHGKVKESENHLCPSLALCSYRSVWGDMGASISIVDIGFTM